MEKRICLLAGQNRLNIIQDYVLYIARKLSKISDVYYFADGRLSQHELNKIKLYTKYAEAIGHRASDFGSWQCLINHIGFKNISSYDRLIVCNDTIYGPLNNIEDIFAYMDLNDYDFWGLSEIYNNSFHHNSYFMVFKKDIIIHPRFQQFWKDMNPNGHFKSYESIISPFLTELGFKGGTYIKNYKKEEPLNYPIHLLRFNQEPFIHLSKDVQLKNENILFGNYALKTAKTFKKTISAWFEK